MLVAAGMAAINCVYAGFVLTEPSVHREEPARGIAKTRVLENAFVRRMCLIYFIFTFAVVQLEAVFAFFMMDRFRYDARQVAFILVMMALIMVAIQGGAIRSLARRYGERNLLMAGALLLCLSFAVVPWVQLVPALLIPLAVASLGRGISQPSMLSLVSHASQSNTRGAVMGTFQSSASLARTTGPLVAGFIYDIYIGHPFLLGSVLMLVVLMLAAVLPAPHDVKIEDVELAMQGESTQL
jgi:MFS family permease